MCGKTQHKKELLCINQTDGANALTIIPSNGRNRSKSAPTSDMHIPNGKYIVVTPDPSTTNNTIAKPRWSNIKNQCNSVWKLRGRILIKLAKLPEITFHVILVSSNVAHLHMHCWSARYVIKFKQTLFSLLLLQNNWI